MSEKYITQEMIREILRPRLEIIKQEVQRINLDAADYFYSVSPGTYNRTMSFENLGRKPDEKETDTGYELTYTYRASDVSVNPWGPFPGSSEWAFDADFVNGYHGGPHRLKNGWSWATVNQTAPSPWQYICDEINNL